MMWEKKSTTPSLAFPFALILNKKCSFTEKVDMCFGESQISRQAKYGFQEVSQALHDSFLASVDFYDM